MLTLFVCHVGFGDSLKTPVAVPFLEMVLCSDISQVWVGLWGFLGVVGSMAVYVLDTGKRPWGQLGHAFLEERQGVWGHVVLVSRAREVGEHPCYSYCRLSVGGPAKDEDQVVGDQEVGDQVGQVAASVFQQLELMACQLFSRRIGLPLGAQGLAQ